MLLNIHIAKATEYTQCRSGDGQPVHLLPSGRSRCLENMDCSGWNIMLRGPWIFNFTQSINYYVVWANEELREKCLWSEKGEINYFWKPQSIWGKGVVSNWVVAVLQLLYSVRGAFMQDGTFNPDCKLQLHGHALAAIIKCVLISTQWEWENKQLLLQALSWTGPRSLPCLFRRSTQNWALLS